MKQIAKLKYLRIAPRKVRVVADLIKGLPVNEAEAQLLVESRRAAAPLLKLLRSAVADAKNNQHADSEKLYIESLRVDQGPMLKRILPRARGMATPIHKKMSHVMVVLADNLTLKSPRFKITVEKKIKTKEKKVNRPPREKSIKEGSTTPEKPKSPGFFKRVFSRKSGFAK